MKVHNPSFGEVVDRMAILKLKQAAGHSKNTDVSHFVEEGIELSEYLRERYGLVNTADVARCVREMLSINSELWERIDRAHDFEMPDCKYASLSRSIVRLNDVRAAKIIEITERYFPGTGRREKI